MLKTVVTLFALCLASTLQAQWPPAPATPAPIMQKVHHLAGNRFVPSTKHWNLVWADQLIPNNISAAQLKFAAEHYVATQKIWANQVAQFRAINPNFLCVAYHLAAGLNPAHNDDCPNPRSQSGSGFIGSIAPKGYVGEYTDYFEPWLAINSIPESSARYEAMFQHYDLADSLHRVWHNDPAWLMNISNDDYQRYLADVSLDWMKGNDNEGCFFDVAVETNSSLYNPKISDPAPVNFDWWASPHGPAGETAIPDRAAFSTWMNARFLSCYQTVYNRFHTSDTNYLAVPNVDQMVTTVYDPVWLDGNTNGETIDGAMMESFGSYRGQDMWLSMERCVRHITGRGKILIAQFYDTTQAERMRRTAMYMLVKNENSFLNILGAGGVEWYPEYEIDLGDQSPLPSTLDALRIMGSGWQSLWARDYARGRVLCNTSDAAMSMSLASDAEWALVTTSGGGKVSDAGAPAMSIKYQPVSGTITIPAASGIILTRTDLQGVPNSSDAFNITVSPNPAANNINISLEQSEPTDVDVSLSNLLGQSVAVSHRPASGSQAITMDVQKLPAGLYECTVRTARAIRHMPVIIQH